MAACDHSLQLVGHFHDGLALALQEDLSTEEVIPALLADASQVIEILRRSSQTPHAEQRSEVRPFESWVPRSRAEAWYPIGTLAPPEKQKTRIGMRVFAMGDTGLEPRPGPVLR